MAKAKQKRVKRELEKLQRAGRHLEWLAEVQGQPLTPELKRELDQAWQEVQRRTLRTPQTFLEFHTQIDHLQGVPDTPEITFIMALRRLIAGDREAEAEATVLAVTGLTGAHLAAQKNMRATLGVSRDWPGITGLLTLMAREPGKTTRRHYQDLAERFSGTVLAQPFAVLAEGMVVFRKLNHKANLHKPLAARLVDELDLADHHLGLVTESFSLVLQRLVLLPFAYQVLLYLRQCDPLPAANQVKALVQAVELTFLRGTGNMVPPELCAQLFDDDQDLLTGANLKKMAEDFATAPFEGKLTLLRDLRQAFQTTLARGPGSPFFVDFFDDDDSEAMAKQLLRFHVQVLKEIGRRLPDLAPREGRALIAVIDPILADDVGDLFMELGDQQPLLDFLLQVAEAGCLGTRLSQVAYLMAIRDRNKRLGALALKAVEEAPVPGLEDLHWLMRGHGRLVIRFPALLKALFDRIRGNELLVRSLVKAVWAEVETFAPPGSEARGRAGHRAAATEQLSPEVRKGLVELAGQVAELEPLRHYLTIFPAGRIDAKSLRQWFEETWKGGDYALFIATAQASIIGDSESAKVLDLVPGPGKVGKLSAVANRLLFTGALIDFLREHADDFRSIPLASARLLVETLYPHLKELTDFGSLLIRTYNALCTRVSAGETEFAPLRDALDHGLRQMAGGQRGPGRPFKR
ncbi:MAG: hypothetical protein JZU50_09500 [Desulfobulbaceae bacterium]|nr:hypothetical protein [Desulfobulbaceae bacterium]